MDHMFTPDEARAAATRTRLSFDLKARFPAKLYSVANDGFLVTWNPDGTSILVEENLFEEKVMSSYPGFVQIASFLNFRRLFREYSFDWRVVEGTDSVFEFSHSIFLRHRPDLLEEITTKRKSVRRRLVTADNNHGRRRYRRRLKATSTASDSSSDTLSEITGSVEPYSHHTDNTPTSSIGCNWDTTQTVSSDGCKLPADISTPSVSNLQLYSSTQVLNAMDSFSECQPCQQDLMHILSLYAKNELSEEEHLQLIANAAACMPNNREAEITDDARESISAQLVPSLTAQDFSPLDIAPRSGQYLAYNGYEGQTLYGMNTYNNSRINSSVNGFYGGETRSFDQPLGFTKYWDDIYTAVRCANSVVNSQTAAMPTLPIGVGPSPAGDCGTVSEWRFRECLSLQTTRTAEVGSRNLDRGLMSLTTVEGQQDDSYAYGYGYGPRHLAQGSRPTYS